MSPRRVCHEDPTTSRWQGRKRHDLMWHHIHINTQQEHVVAWDLEAIGIARCTFGTKAMRGVGPISVSDQRHARRNDTGIVARPRENRGGNRLLHSAGPVGDAAHSGNMPQDRRRAA